ncbi:MAG TPA: hypothetical protein VK191_00085 [Symbiobacteriaceae bacterium]|nr:hypothetical protein [Symbiobacteriaceae bacterium]
MRPQLRLRPAEGAPPPQPLPLISLRLRRSVGWPVGQVEATFGPGPALPGLLTKVVVEGAADGDAFQPLFTGTVLQERTGLAARALLVEELPGSLTRLFPERVVTDQTVADAIGAICQEAKLTSQVPAPGPTLKGYPLLKQDSALDQIKRLAAVAGFTLWTDVQGNLHAGEPPTTGTASVDEKGPLLAATALAGEAGGARLILAALPPADLAEPISLPSKAGSGSPRLVGIDLHWSVQTGLVTHLTLTT